MDYENTEPIPALGRPFKLGMLYDSYSDTLIPSMTLWSMESLEKGVITQSHNQTESDVLIEESFENKAQALEVKGQLKLSLMLGLAEVGGIAKYVQDTHSTDKTARVTLKYKVTTRFDQLLDHTSPENIERSENLDNDFATHAVLGIEYGMEAFLIFEEEIHDKSESDKIKGKLKAEIDNFANSAMGKISSTKKAEKNKEWRNIKVKVYCDCQIDSNPTTFQEAIEFYKSLPDFLKGDNEMKAVPQKVYLLPLTLLGGDALPGKWKNNEPPKISLETFTNTLESTLHYLDRALVYIEDIEDNNMTKNFQHLHNRLQTLKSCISSYKTNLLSKCRQIVPEIRRKGNSKQLDYLIDSYDKGPFTKKTIEKWFFEDKQERDILEGFSRRLTNIKSKINKGNRDNNDGNDNNDNEEQQQNRPDFVTDYGEFTRILIENKHVICLEIRIEYNTDDILISMEKNLWPTDTEPTPKKTTTIIDEHIKSDDKDHDQVDFTNYQVNAWYNTKSWKDINNKVDDFVRFYKTNSKYVMVTYLIRPEESKLVKDEFGASIFCYVKSEYVGKEGLPAEVEKKKEREKSSFCNLL